jgi:hypothetical protein
MPNDLDFFAIILKGFEMYNDKALGSAFALVINPRGNINHAFIGCLKAFFVA